MPSPPSHISTARNKPRALRPQPLPSPLIELAKLQGSVSKDAQPSDTVPALSYRWSALPSPEAPLSTPSQPQSVSTDGHIQNHTVKKLLIDNQDQLINDEQLFGIGDNVLITTFKIKFYKWLQEAYAKCKARA